MLRSESQDQEAIEPQVPREDQEHLCIDTPVPLMGERPDSRILRKRLHFSAANVFTSLIAAKYNVFRSGI